MTTNKLVNVFGEICGGNVSPVTGWDPQTAYEYVEFCLRGLEVKSREAFEIWLRNDLRRLFPYGMLLCGLGNFQATGLIAKHLVSIDCPIECGNTIKRCGSLLDNSIISKWLVGREPQLVDTKSAHDPGDCSTSANVHNLGKMASHGMVDVDGRTGTYFFFHRIPDHANERHAKLLKLLIPHLHQAFTRAVQPSADSLAVTRKMRQSLTHRELEVLDLLIKGKSNWEISKISNRSLTTVKHEVSKILSKLSVTTRVQAAARGVDLGLLDFMR